MGYCVLLLINWIWNLKEKLIWDLSPVLMVNLASSILVGQKYHEDTYIIKKQKKISEAVIYVIKKITSVLLEI